MNAQDHSTKHPSGIWGQSKIHLGVRDRKEWAGPLRKNCKRGLGMEIGVIAHPTEKHDHHRVQFGFFISVAGISTMRKVAFSSVEVVPHKATQVVSYLSQ